MYPSRKKFRFQVVPSDQQLWAIGLIVVQWSGIEMLVSSLITGLTDEGSPEHKTFLATWAWSDRLEQIQDLASERLMQPWNKEICDWLIEVRQIQDLRDKIVHGTWGGKPNTPIEEPIGSGGHVFNWKKPHAVFQWDLQFGKLMEIAYRIDHAQASIFDFMFRNIPPGQDPTKNSVALADALRHRLRKASPA